MHLYGSNRSPDPPIWDFPDLHRTGGFSGCFLGATRSKKPPVLCKSGKSHIGGRAGGYICLRISAQGNLCEPWHTPTQAGSYYCGRFRHGRLFRAPCFHAGALSSTMGCYLVLHFFSISHVTRCYANSASGPEIGLPGWISARLSGKPQNRSSGWPEGRF